jgi:hypothetical protein
VDVGGRAPAHWTTSTANSIAKVHSLCVAYQQLVVIEVLVPV